MQYDLCEVALVGDLIFDTLTKLIAMGIVDVDINDVNIGLSALKAIENMYLKDDNRIKWDEKTEAGLWRKGIHYATAAVYFDGTPVFVEGMEIVEPVLVGHTKDGS